MWHGSELVLVFRFVPHLLSADERRLADTMISYWTSFAKDGTPTAELESGVAWPSYDPSTDELLQIGNGTSTAVGAVRGARKAECDFWDTFG